ISSLRAGQKQICKIRTGDEKHEYDSDLHDPYRAADAAENLVAQWLHLKNVAALLAAQRREDMTFDSADALAPVLNKIIQLPLSRLRRNTVLQPADQVQEVAAAIARIGGVQTEGQPDLGAVLHEIRTGRHDADHLPPDAIHFHFLTDHWLACKCALP